MATNRVLIGNRSTGGYGLYVSKANSNVLSCDKKDLLFDSTQKVSGLGNVYAGGSLSSLSGDQNFLTTGSKDNLGYIPVVICTETRNTMWNFGSKVTNNIKISTRQNNISMFSFTSSVLRPIRVDSVPYNSQGVVNDRRTTVALYGGNTGGSQACTNLEFVVLKMPCAYGYMTNTYF